MKQGFIVQAIGTDNDRVARANLDAGNVGGLLLGPGNVIAISAMTPGTTERASYTWSIQP
jgi:hypothetical protein